MWCKHVVQLIHGHQIRLLYCSLWWHRKNSLTGRVCPLRAGHLQLKLFWRIDNGYICGQLIFFRIAILCMQILQFCVCVYTLYKYIWIPILIIWLKIPISNVILSHTSIWMPCSLILEIFSIFSGKKNNKMYIWLFVLKNAGLFWHYTISF